MFDFKNMKSGLVYILLKKSKRESKKGDKMFPKWCGPYKIVEISFSIT